MRKIFKNRLTFVRNCDYYMNKIFASADTVHNKGGLKMYRNLEAELKRKGITRKMLADKLGINIATVSAKLTGKAKLTFDEATTIAKQVFNGEFDVVYLFDKGENQKKEN